MVKCRLLRDVNDNEVVEDAVVDDSLAFFVFVSTFNKINVFMNFYYLLINMT